MLLYLNTGQRTYHEQFNKAYIRHRWEFQAVLNGYCAPLFKNGPGKLETKQLWVFGPGHAHAWTAPAEAVCQIAVAHFDLVPEPLRQWVGHTGMRSTPLSTQQCKHIEDLFASIQPDYVRPTWLSGLRFDHAMLELSMLAMKEQRDHPLTTQQEYARRKVSQALAWYGEHMTNQPSVEQVADAVHVSSSHLRRLFTLADKHSPLAAMRQMQIDRACQLIQGPRMAMTDVATACGFSSLSAFSRSFHTQVGVSPRVWRKRENQRQQNASTA